MKQDILPVEAIRERDVDLILLEELNTDNSFCEWFIRELGLPDLTINQGAWRSISDFGLGETDILFSYKSRQRKIYVLIENKLDTSFQEKQFDRYTQRKERYVSDKKCDKAYCVLLAPEFYCNNQNEFETFISYESISKRFEFTGTKRNLFKSELLKIASEKLRRGYQPVNSETVQKFWKSYWAFKEQKYPTLKMKRPEIVPHGSDWPEMRDEELLGIIFYHKLGQGNVDATFCNYSDEDKYKIKELIPGISQFIKHSKSFSIRINVGKIDRTKDFEEQKDKVQKGLDNIEFLRNWIKKQAK